MQRRRQGEAGFDERVITRRNLFHGVAGAALVCSLDGPSALLSGQRTSAGLRAQATKRLAPFQTDLPIPPVLEPVSTSGGVDRYEITMRAGDQQILEGETTEILGYEGMFPGPTIKAKKGRRVEVTQINDLGEDAVVHLHGAVTPPQFDGHPDDVIPPGEEFTYEYPNKQRGATLWYHEHGHGFTAKGVYEGRAAMYLLEDKEERKLDLPRGRYDVPLMIADRNFDVDNQFLYPGTFPIDGVLGNSILVNGAVSPRMRVERRLYRLRLLNASNARTYELALSHGESMTQIAADSGGLLPKPYKRRVITLCPAERADVIIDFRNFTPGSELVLRNRAGESESTRKVMRFDVVRGGKETARVPKRLRDPVLMPAVVGERTFDLTLDTDPELEWQINGLGFDHDRIDADPSLGTTERWHWVNSSDSMHPMHTHLAHFKVESVGNRLLHPADMAMKDTVAVPPNETATVRVLFAGYPGRYVFHCHALEHGDRNMMAQMQVSS